MPESTHSNRSDAWLLASVPLIMLLMFVLPYTVLRDVNAWYGSLLFWIAATLAVIAINVVLTRRWKD